MLVLSRKPEQKIHIGKNIVVTILKIQGDQVSIGIEAPKDTPIYRDELVKNCKPKTSNEDAECLSLSEAASNGCSMNP